MKNCKIKFHKKDNELASQLLSAIARRGVSCEDIDKAGDGNGVVSPNDILDFALNDYEKFRGEIEGVFKSPLTFVLNDNDPSTNLDEKVRERTDKTIVFLRELVGGEKDKVFLEGLFHLTAVPDSATISQHSDEFEKETSRLTKNGLSKFRDYLRENGGFYLLKGGDKSKEYSALKAIENQWGECSENSKILFAIFKRAGYKPVFVLTDIREEGSKKPEPHLCVGVYIESKLQIFDPSNNEPDAHYEKYRVLSLREFVSLEFRDRGVIALENGNRDKAFKLFSKSVQLDNRSVEARYCLGIALLTKDQPLEAILNLKKAIKLEPDYANTYVGMASALARVDQKKEAIDNLALYYKKKKDASYDSQTEKFLSSMLAKSRNGVQKEDVEGESILIIACGLWMAGQVKASKDLIDRLATTVDVTDTLEERFGDIVKIMPEGLLNYLRMSIQKPK